MVAIAKRTGICCICGEQGKYGYWGKYYCKKCFFEHFKVDPEEIADKTSNGHSGMLALNPKELNLSLSQLYLFNHNSNYPILIKVPKGNKIFATLYLTHYPQSKGIVGRSLNYIIVYKNKIVGIIGACSPPYSVKAIDEFFGINKNNRNQKLKQILNNEIFRLIYHEKNLGTKVLKIFREVIKKDYKEKYKDDLIGLITFVEPPLTGTVYKADNWIYLGMTKGYGTLRRGKRWFDRKWIRKTPKHIFAYKYNT